MKLKTLLVAALFLMPMSWAGLISTSVAGVLNFGGGGTNWYDSAHGFVPGSGFLNSAGATTVTIAEPAVEFGFDDGSNRDVTNFSDTQLIFTDTVESTGGNNSIHLVFTDTAFTNLSLAGTTFTGMTFNLTNHVITIDIPSFSVTRGQTFNATFNVSAPEPGTFILLGAGLAGVGLIRRRIAK